LTSSVHNLTVFPSAIQTLDAPDQDNKNEMMPWCGSSIVCYTECDSACSGALQNSLRRLLRIIRLQST